MTKPTENRAQGDKLRGNPGKHRARVSDGSTYAYLQPFTDYLRALKQSPATIAAYTQHMQQFFIWLDSRDPRGVRRDDVLRYQAWLLDQNYRPQTAHVKLRALRRFYDFQEKTGKVLINPTEGVPWPSLGDRLPRNVLTRSEVKRLLDTPDTSTPVGVRDKAMLELFYSTGIRRAELCSLTIYDVDIRSGFLRVQGKGSKERVVPMGHMATEYMKEYLKHVRGRLTKKQRDERALFVGERWGRPLNKLILGRLVRHYGRTAGFKKNLTPHVLRHTCATHMLAGGADIVHVQRLLGHADITTTQIYVRVAQRDVKKMHDKCHPAEKDNLPDQFKPVRKFRADYNSGSTT